MFLDRTIQRGEQEHSEMAASIHYLIFTNQLHDVDVYARTERDEDKSHLYRINDINNLNSNEIKT